MKSHTKAAYEKVVEQIIRGGLFPACTVLMSDKETAVHSLAFRLHCLEEYGVSIHYLSRLR
jgi:hypothetical protein